MNTGAWIGLVAVVVAVIGIVASVLAARRWGHRRRKVLFSWDSARLLPAGRPEQYLEVTFRGFPVANPYLVTTRAVNIGASDIASEHFDAAKPLVVRLNSTMYGLTSTSDAANTISGAIGSSGIVELRPTLLRRGEEWVVEAVVDGEPHPTIESSLVDTDIVQGPSAFRLAAEQLASTAVVLGLPFGVELRLNRFS